MTIEKNMAAAGDSMRLIAALKEQFKGNLLVEGDANYETARHIWNGMIDRKPILVAQCTDTKDVQMVVQMAAKYNYLLSVKAGGHNVGGTAVCNDGIMIDLSLMKKITVDAANRSAAVEMGATWAEFDGATQAHGLATTGGVVNTTGVAGLTLGGGVGWLVRKHGLSCDNLLEAEIVLADGSIVKASHLENQELFWGLRGGGGNFGVVTTMKFRLHEVSTVLGGMILHTRDKAREVIAFYRDFIQTAPNELTLYCALVTSPDGIPVVALAGCYCGDLETGEAVLKPLREFGAPVADLVQPMPYVNMQAMLGPGFPTGNRYYWKSGFLKDLSDEAISVFTDQMAANPSPLTAGILEYYHGAAEPEGGTSYPYRQSEFDLVVISNWPSKEGDEANISWIRGLWEAVQPYLSHKAYVNALGSEGKERVKEAYGENYARLVELKRRYDPNNLFRMNQNISPE